jgi:hypothetical protein
MNVIVKRTLLVLKANFLQNEQRLFENDEVRLKKLTKVKEVESWLVHGTTMN